MAKVLVVDDEIAFAELAKLLLEGLGHSAVMCLEGAKVLDTALRMRPDVIITDINLPDMDGLTVIEGLKARPETKSIPIIIASSSTDKSDRVEALRLGAVYSIVKPLQKEMLKLVIDKILSTKH